MLPGAVDSQSTWRLRIPLFGFAFEAGFGLDSAAPTLREPSVKPSRPHRPSTGPDQPTDRHVLCSQGFRAPVLGFVLKSIAAGALGLGAVVVVTPAHASSSILIDADSGKVLRAENATYPWYPASTTKLMTLYVTLSAVRDHRISFDTLFPVSPNAAAQSPTKMGFPTGTQVTVDNALKMMMVKSANDMAVLLAEGIGGSIDDFAQEMTDTAHRLGMSESNFVNPNGLPADGQIMSARDLAILARALIREFPEYSSYWHIPAIKWGRRVVRNYNPLLGRYAGADGMKTGFICASGFNIVATATRDNKQLIAVVLGAPSSTARAIKAAELLEGGFSQRPLSWLTPSLGTVDALTPIDAAPPNLKDAMCGPHRKRPATEEDDPDALPLNGASADGGGEGSPQFSVLLSALRAPTPKNLLLDAGPVTPVVVYTGPTRSPAQVAMLAAVPEAADPPAGKKKAKHRPEATKPAGVKAAAAKSVDGAPDTKTTAAKPVDGKSAAKLVDGKAKDDKAATGAAPHPASPKLAATPAAGAKPEAAAATPNSVAKPKPPAASNFQQ
jgi:D-alanyl-D-alanine carboxypeptidase